MSKPGMIILNTLYEENVITLADIQQFIDSKQKKPTQRVKPKQNVNKSESISKHTVYNTDPCSRGGGGGRSAC